MNEPLRYFIEKVVTHYSTKNYYDQLIHAKNFYFDKTGKALEEDPDYESRMSSFNDWYVLEYKKEEGKSLIEDYIEKFDPASDLVDAVKSYCHSVYEFTGKNLFGRYVVIDLLSKKKIKLSKSHSTPSLVKGDLFLGRVATYGGEEYLFNGLCLLPRQCLRTILKETKKVVIHNDEELTKDFLFKTEEMKTRWLRYGHVNVERIFVYPANLNYYNSEKEVTRT